MTLADSRLWGIVGDGTCRRLKKVILQEFTIPVVILMFDLRYMEGVEGITTTTRGQCSLFCGRPWDNAATDVLYGGKMISVNTEEIMREN